MKARRRIEPKMTTVVVEREYQLLAKGRKKKTVVLQLAKPRPFPDGRDYYCVYRLQGLGDGDHTGRAGGVDGMQALYLAMQMAHVSLVCSCAYKEGRLTWLGSFDLGLPVMQAIEDLIKADAEHT